MNLNLVVKVIENKKIKAGYVRKIDNFNFAPTIGMKFNQGISTNIWENENKIKLSPPVKEVVYNLDEESIYCLFEIDCHLSSSFWNKINNLDRSFELSQFE